MRINKIEIQNFRAFYGNFEIELGGKNLLLYGENGSGKSSLFYALKLFLESANAKTEFSEHRNIFIKDDDDGFVKLTVGKNTYEWLLAKFPDAPIILDANKTKGFLEYKNLLETHFLNRQEKRINLFYLLVENLLSNYTEPSSQRTVQKTWQDVKSISTDKRTRSYRSGTYYKKTFNDVIEKALADLTENTNKLLSLFNYQITCGFVFSEKSIALDIKFFDRPIKNYHSFLNEARLSAIALSIYLASILQQPKSDLQILALDDVLIGLDMANRLPVIDILEQHFSEHQIFFITHDKLWFEMMRMRVQRNEKWKNAELYSSQNNGLELPVYVENKKYLERAKEHLEANDYKAAAVYARSAFEFALKRFCESKNLKIKFRENIKDLESNDFWTEIKQHKKGDISFLNVKFIDEIELCRSVILNPLSHSQIINITQFEVGKAIEIVEQLEKALGGK